MKKAFSEHPLPRFFKKNLLIFLFFISTIVATVVLFPFFHMVNQYLAEQSVNNTIGIIERANKSEEAYLLQQAKDLSTAPSILEGVRNHDSLSLLDILSKEDRDRGLDANLIADQNGIVLTRSDSNKRGDYIFNTTAWGAKLAEGKSVASIEQGATNPLIEIGAYPIQKDGKLLGAIIPANIITDDYATKFQQKYLDPGTKIAYYATGKGIIASSLNNSVAAAMLSAYIDSYPNIYNKYQPNYFQPIRLINDYFNLGRIVLYGSDGKIIGLILILTPSQPVTIAIVMATTITILFLFLAPLWLPHKINKKDKKIHVYTTSLALVLFITILLLIQAKIKSWTFNLTPPQFTIYNSTMRFEPEYNITNKFVEQKTSIVVYPGGESINAVTADIEYDPQTIMIKEIITDNSWCNPDLFLEKNIDNINGKVTITCLLPNPGFSGSKGVVAALAIQPLREGQFFLRFGPDTKVLANDGLGTNVLRRADNGSYQVVDEQPSTNKPLKQLTVFSSSHPNKERWYMDKKINLSWLNQRGSTFQHALNRLPNFVPDKEVTTTKKTALEMAIEDGIYYFHLLETRNGAPVGLTHYKIMIDSTPPPPPVIKTSSNEINEGEIVRFELQNLDQSSSTQPGFFIRINQGLFLPVRSPLSIPFISSGNYQVDVRVFDKAGNFSDAATTINVR